MENTYRLKQTFICTAIALAISGCASTAPKGKYVDGSHEVSAKGKKSQIVLAVDVENGNIKEISTKSHNETESLYLNAERLLPKIVANNGHEEIDAVSGATYSSNGILQAINDLPRADGSQPEFQSVGSTQTTQEAFKLKWSVQPQLGLVAGDYYYQEERFRQGHMGSMTVVLDSNNPNDIILAEFNEDGRPNYYTRLYQDVPKRMSEYNFSMGKKKGTAWIQSAVTMEQLMMAEDKLIFEENPNWDPKLANKLKQPNRLKYAGLDIVAGASNSIQQSLVPLSAKIHHQIQTEGSQLKFYQHAEKLVDSNGKWIGQTALLRFVVDSNSKKIVDVYYDEIFADEKKQITDASLKNFYRQSKYQSVMYEEPARIGFNVMMDALEQHIVSGGSMFDIDDLPATGDSGSYAATGFTKLSSSWANYLKQADILYQQMQADGVIETHSKG
ncbi:FMN-binding protein [Ferrimonas lipolytica]|uniref:FMN-binding protein n=1 Tax=Ferrimonas lipolytica TaxID=2724191 RepID=A0A6H1UF56_9GAMM|nr:FMN-binding protein [Ferrimonas lipolytica]QIZ76973.1 FMN-binding protein [Ferrimonas lipolytica]